MRPTLDHAQAAALLAFYRDAGVDACVGDEPVDRFAAVEPPPAPPPAQPRRAAPLQGSGPPDIGTRTPEPPASLPLLTPDAATQSSQRLAAEAQNLDQLRAAIESFDGCPLKKGATRTVFADGNPQARIMFVGEAPGREEDLQGLPFVGRSGRLLDLMLAAAGFDRSNVYISNIIPWRPPGNRDPSPQETAICLPFIKRHIELVDPDILVCLGRPSATALLDLKEGILRARGRWVTYRTDRRDIRATVGLHPAYLLRQPLQKRLAWRDFLAIRQALGHGDPNRPAPPSS